MKAPNDLESESRGRRARPDPLALWRLGRSHLDELRTDHGFMASEADTGLYPAIYGRDSLWILLFLLEAVDRNPALPFVTWVREAGRTVLRTLAELQGTEVDNRIEEQPGKIVHEYHDQPSPHALRMGIPLRDGRSFAGFDETFLFVVALRRFTEQFPDEPLLEETWSSLKAALAWIDASGDEDDDGLFEYRRRNPDNLVNQIWKDSYDAITVNGFDIPTQPVAWIASQAYAFRALQDAASMLERRGQDAWAPRLRAKAERLKEEVDRSFWLEDQGCFAIGLDGRKRAIPLVASDPGHALWAGLVKAGRQKRLITRMMHLDLSTPYGIRTLASTSDFYAPFAYHRGAIWPFDNAVFALGLSKAERHREARIIMEAVGRAILRIGSPVEAYVSLDPKMFVEPQGIEDPVLSHRRSVIEPVSGQRVPMNRSQGWTAAAVVYFAAALAAMDGVPLPDG